jgi:prepilin-type N-terminal cleavage/methylation domain-containing protein
MKAPFIKARRGFTVIEMMLTAFLMALLAMVLGNAWAAFGRPAISSVARCRVAQEANLAAEALARDIGLLAQDIIGPPAPTDSRYVKAASPQSDGSTLSLLIDDGTLFHSDGTRAARSIVYSFDKSDNKTHLVRTETNPIDLTSTVRVVATLVSDFHVKHGIIPVDAQTRVPSGPIDSGTAGDTLAPGVQVDMTFGHPAYDRVNGVFQPIYARRFTLFIPDP